MKPSLSTIPRVALLFETNLSITAIANACGFTSKSYLGKVFRRAHGITMTDFICADEPNTPQARERDDLVPSLTRTPRGNRH